MKKSLILLALCLLISCVQANDIAMKRSQQALESTLLKQKEIAENRVSERQKLSKELDALREGLAEAREVANSLAMKKGDFQLNLHSAADRSVRLNRELKSFYAKFQAAKIEHNLSRAISYLGVAGQIKNIQSESLRDFFKVLQIEELQATKFQRINSEYVNFSNEKIKGELWLAGNIGGYAIKPDVGLIMMSGTAAIVKKSGSLSSDQRALLKDGLVLQDLPFDVTGGEALHVASEEPSFWGRIQQGGVVVYPILFVGFLGVGIILVKILFLFSVGGNALLLESKILEASKNDSWDQLKSQLQNGKTYIQQLLCASLEKRAFSKENFEGFVEEKIYAYIALLEKMMATLNVLGVISPLLGLLGTVTGMIATFDVIAVHGAGDPGLLSKGISEALITTQLGLVVAVPIILFHSLLNSKIEKSINEMEMMSNFLVSQLYEVPDEKGESKA